MKVNYVPLPSKEKKCAHIISQNHKDILPVQHILALKQPKGEKFEYDKKNPTMKCKNNTKRNPRAASPELLACSRRT